MPQAGCHRDRCVHAARDPALRRFVACLGLVDPATGQRWLVDATPDLPSQLAELDGRAAPPGPPPGLAGIFLTHAHVGHYTGLMFLGREVIGSRQVPVYARPRMEKFLRGSGPWNQLIALHNIDLRPLRREQGVSLVDGLTVTPFLVPHRQEYSETVAFRIKGPHRTLAYLPDIDRWEKMDPSIESLLAQVDVAVLDGTFYSGGELPGRNMDEIPHPTMKDTMRRLAGLPLELRRRVRFIHLNHTNPALDTESDAGRWLRQAGFLVARQGEQFGL
ncbi:MAG: MBL fold metallo-hydrolase [Acidobacteriota bacterium]